MIKTYFEAWELLKKRSSREAVEQNVGLSVVTATLECRIDPQNGQLYREGGRGYRRREEARIFTGITGLVEEKPLPMTVEELEARFHDRLLKYRDVRQIDFVYDAVKVFALERGKEPDYIGSLVAFMGKDVVEAVVAHEHLQEYDLRKEGTRMREWGNMKKQLERDLARMFHYRFG